MTVTVTFNPKKTGLMARSLVFASNDAQNSSKSIKLLGYGTDQSSVGDNPDITLSLNMTVGTNPVIDNAEITFLAGKGSTPVNSRISLSNSLGQEVKVLFDGIAYPFYNKINFSAANIASGIYYLVLTSENKIVKSRLLYLNNLFGTTHNSLP